MKWLTYSPEVVSARFVSIGSLTEASLLTQYDKLHSLVSAEKSDLHGCAVKVNTQEVIPSC